MSAAAGALRRPSRACPDLIEVDYTIKPAYKRLQGAADRRRLRGARNAADHHAARADSADRFGRHCALSLRRQRRLLQKRSRDGACCGWSSPSRCAIPRTRTSHACCARAPDQLISSNTPELFVAPEEPALPIDPEYVRVISHNQSADEAGLDAMQPMTQATGPDKDADRFYLSAAARGPAPRIAGALRLLHLRVPRRALPLHRRLAPPREGRSRLDAPRRGATAERCECRASSIRRRR